MREKMNETEGDVKRERGIFEGERRNGLVAYHRGHGEDGVDQRRKWEMSQRRRVRPALRRMEVAIGK
jgi:hypothetical protein